MLKYILVITFLPFRPWYSVKSVLDGRPVQAVQTTGRVTNGVHFIGAGPYMAFGIGGNYRAAIMTRKLLFGNGEADDFAKKDAGISFQAGRSFGQSRLGVGLDWELSNNVSRQARSLSTSVTLRRHRVLAVFYSYIFRTKPPKEQK